MQRAMCVFPVRAVAIAGHIEDATLALKNGLVIYCIREEERGKMQRAPLSAECFFACACSA